MFLTFSFKDKVKWGQIPWVQGWAKVYSNRLLLDVVSMKLPINALIFLASLDVDFNVNFLSRCRMNAVDGDQVSFNYLKLSRVNRTTCVFLMSLEIYPVCVIWNEKSILACDISLKHFLVSKQVLQNLHHQFTSSLNFIPVIWQA